MLRPTIDDVARIAGVSIATVSRCLHTPDVVAPATRARILAAVEQTGYTLNTAAQTLRQRRSNTILVVVPDIGNTFFSEILGGIQHHASAAGLTMLIGDTGREPERERRYISYLLNGRADGALLLSEPLAEWFEVPIANAHGVRPIVTVSEVGPNHQNPAVFIDNEAASYAAVSHLVERGHRRIAHLTGPHTNILSAHRLRGYQRALQDKGIDLDPKLEFAGDFSMTSGRNAFAAYSILPDKPSALFCANDESAMGFISSANRQGVRVPQDISVVGFDDIHFAQCFIPPLTTVRQPRAEMGAQAVALLLSIMANETPRSVELAPEFVLRDSTAVLPGS